MHTNFRTLVSLAALTATTGATFAADTYSFVVNSPASSAAYDVSTNAPFQGTMVGNTAATPATRTKTGTIRIFPPGVNCGTFGATQNDPLAISGAIVADGMGSNIRPTGAFTLVIDPVAGTSGLSGLSLNVLGTSTASVDATLEDFRYPTFCTVDPVCSLPYLVPISLALGTFDISSVTAVQGAGTAVGTLSPVVGGFDFAIPVIVTITASASFAGAPFPLTPQQVPIVFAGRIEITGNSATVTTAVDASVIPPAPTTATELPLTPLTTPSGTSICEGLNLILALTFPANSIQITVLTSANIVADGTRAACPCDWNGVGGVTVQDIFDFLASYFANDADFNNSGSTTTQDIFDFLICYFSLPSPC